MKAIHTLIGMDFLKYQNLKDNAFQRWCKDKAKLYKIPHRAFMYDSKICNWYMHTFKQRIEDAFVMENQDYIFEGVEDAPHYRDLFHHIANEESNLMNIYPKVLLDSAKTKFYATSRFTNTAFEITAMPKYLQN